jgi:beta-glucosidase
VLSLLTADAISHWDEIWDTLRAEPGTWTVKVGRDAQTFFGGETFEVGKNFSWSGL